ncbi:hypothetical protein [Hirschia litorea]|uniref:DoxX family protein n=1 Tax=Hirschia litorea TaxID=1199156 RepID=A0ABW2ILP3_9PROT
MTAVSKWGAYVLAAFMAFMGIQKFIGDVPIFIIIEDNLAADWGLTLPFIDPMLKYATGLGELAATVILVAGLRLIGGGLSLALIGGAILAHLTVLGVYTPMSSAPDAEKSPMLFIMALVFFALSAAVTYGAFKARR